MALGRKRPAQPEPVQQSSKSSTHHLFFGDDQRLEKGNCFLVSFRDEQVKFK